MNDPTTGEGSALPTPTFFDPAFERLPAAASFDAEREGPLLLIFDRAADRDWAADAAIAIATGWHAAGRRTVLADLSLEDPMLAERIGMSSMEGVVDVFLYGASLARSARAVPGRGFYLISAGTYTPDAAAILRHPRWEKLGHGFRETGASLLLFVAADAPGLAALGRHVHDAIVLGERGHGDDMELGIPDFVKVHAWLTPPQDSAPAAAPPAAPLSAAPRPVAPVVADSPFPEPQPTAFAGWGKGGPSQPSPAAPPVGEEFRSAEETVGSPPATLPAPEPGWESAPEPPAPRYYPPLLLALLAAALLAAALYAASLYWPALFGGGGEVRAAASTAAAPARPAGPDTATGVQLPYSVFVKGYETYDAARRRAQQVAGVVPDARLYITMEEEDGRPYYKVFAGQLSDSAEAADLRGRLVGRGLIDAADVGTEADLLLVRPLTLKLGEFATQEQAQARVDTLAAAAIPAYVAAVPYSNGTDRWMVFGGAFEDSTAAAPMIEMLDSARVPAELVRRTGRAPASPK